MWHSWIATYMGDKRWWKDGERCCEWERWEKRRGTKDPKEEKKKYMNTEECHKVAVCWNKDFPLYPFSPPLYLSPSLSVYFIDIRWWLIFCRILCVLFIRFTVIFCVFFRYINTHLFGIVWLFLGTGANRRYLTRTHKRNWLPVKCWTIKQNWAGENDRRQKCPAFLLFSVRSCAV